MRFEELQIIRHDHAGVSQDLALLRTVTASSGPPPEGHAYWGMLREAVGRLARELPAHFVEEEAFVFPPIADRHGPEQVKSLCAEHQAISAILPATLAKLEAVGPRTATWEARREAAAQLDCLIGAHLVAEEAYLRSVAREDEAIDFGEATAP
jgi:iron-sulfur cluster repair protein YtfE (RIC family)